MNNKFTKIFDYKDDKSSKFWEVTQNGNSVIVRYGKAGSNGQSQEKLFSDNAEASKHVAKLISEKIRKGYAEVSVALSAGEISACASDESAKQKDQLAIKIQAQKISSARIIKPKNPAHDPWATSEGLMLLMDKDEVTNRLLAKHPRASAELLEKLSHSSDKATRKAVCLNTNVDKAVLLRLAPQFPSEFFRNPVFDWLLMEDPELLFHLGQGVLKNILKLPDCPQSFLQWAANNGSEQQQLAVAMNSNAPDDLISILASKSGSVADAAKGRLQPQPTEKINFDQVFRDEVIKALDGLDGVNNNHLDQLGYRDIIDVELACYFKNLRNMSTSHAKRIEKRLKNKLLKLTDRKIKKFDFDLVSIFCRSKSRCLRLIGLADSNAQPEILAKNCKSIDWVERLAISRNPSTPANVLALLSKDAHVMVALQAKTTLQIKSENR